jgi:hypothetical protein
MLVGEGGRNTRPPAGPCPLDRPRRAAPLLAAAARSQHLHSPLPPFNFSCSEPVSSTSRSPLIILSGFIPLVPLGSGTGQPASPTLPAAVLDSVANASPCRRPSLSGQDAQGPSRLSLCRYFKPHPFPALPAAPQPNWPHPHSVPAPGRDAGTSLIR